MRRFNDTYEDDYVETPADHGWVHEDDLPDLDNVKDYLAQAVQALYVTGDRDHFEDVLEEILSRFDLKLPATPLVI